ncbi:energy transducer TonB [Faecalibacter bovis]|uniref:TonB C-terminal domain-containing protein n=1 Tax=Faecalibacter bovis TaxID=2898187 RepID=A0ABX7XAQ4_9FLAO|nr:energy transducer TonB [Faecalibacter bovis]QTV04877.1 hypothetical protein J9309_08710 [Faecalibacter bovis]
MKILTFTLGLFMTQFAFGQQIYTADQVDQHAVYPKDCDKTKSTKDCFTISLSTDLANEFDDLVEKFSSGNHVTKISFVINEDGSITDVTPITKDEFGEKTAKLLQVLFAKNEIYNKKIQPAKLNGKNVKMSYSLPVRLQYM